jgi:hypothetical protein
LVTDQRLRLYFAAAALLSVVLESPRAQAERVATWLEVRRARGSEACPDVDRVFRAISRLFPEQPIRRCLDATEASASATVRIRPTSVGHEALVRVTRPREGERVILDREVECDGLADALAVALVMLIEPAQIAPPNELTELPVAPRDEPSQPEASAAPPPNKDRDAASLPLQLDDSPSNAPAAHGSHTRRHWLAGARAMAAFGAGLTSEPSAGAGVGFALSSESGLGLALEGHRLLSLPAKQPPGRVELDLWALLGGPCYRQNLASKAHLDSCLAFGVGSQHAESKGYLHDDSKRRPWMVIGPRLDLGVRLYGWLGGFASLSALGHLKPQSFSVEGVGVVAKAPTVGTLLTLGFQVEGLAF